MRRMTKHDYAAPGSFDRVLEAAIALADADSEDDRAYHRAKMRLLKAMLAYRARNPLLRQAMQEQAAELWLDLGDGEEVRGRRVG